jgi:DNA-binding transcriptional LysR family regulator
MNHHEAMQIFVRVAELASFTQTADSMGLPKASISNAVQQLESTLGTRLLHRTTRRVHMTQDGQMFYERCKDMLVDMEDLFGLFRSAPEALRGRLRVDMPSVVARDIVVPALPGFLDAHPALEIELSSTDRRVDLVREGFDCVLRIGPLADSSLIARPLGRYAMINCASPAYLARYGVPAHVNELAQHRLVHYVTTLGARDPGFEYVDAADEKTIRYVPMPGVVTVNNVDAYRAASLAGLGVIQAPEAGVRDLIDRGQLIEILPDFRAAPMPASLIYANRRHQPKRVQVFMNWLAALMQPMLLQGNEMVS